MSSVCRIWNRSAASAAAPAVEDVPGGGTEAAHAPARTRTRAASMRLTASDATGTRLLTGVLRRHRSCFVRAVLELVQAVIDAMLCEQIAVRAHLHHAALVQHDDAVDV